MSYEQLLLQILDMTPDQRKLPVRVTENTAWAAESHRRVQEVWVAPWNPNDPYLVV